ncbi:MAG: FUSC family protein [Streptosporangiaceae bacterium]
MRDAVAPQWLVEIVRPRRAPVPWAQMVRAALAICVPLAAGLATHHLALGLLPAIGGLIAVTVDTGGPYPARVNRVGSATVFGGAVGLTIGIVIHGRGWIAVAALVVVAGVSVLISDLGSIGSVTGLQLLVYAALGFGPLGGLQPWWSGPLEFLIGVAWSMILIIPSWLLYPRAAEQHAVADVYRAQAARLRAIGTDRYPAARLAVTAAVSAAYDQLLTSRSRSGGPDTRLERLGALLNQTHQLSEAAATLNLARVAPPGEVADAVEAIAGSIQDGTPPPVIPACWNDSAGAQELCDALNGAVRLLTGKQSPEGGLPPPPRSRRERLGGMLDKIRAGKLVRTFAVRLMASVGVAVVVSGILPLQRSYWVVLTVAIVLKPDFGSVFARALQRGIGTIVGAVLGAVILAIVPYGQLLLIPIALLAALLPYGRSRNYGLLSTFLTPLVVVLIDLLDRSGWRLAEARLIDTLLGCAIALVVGYAPWPSSWHAHVPSQLAEAIGDVSRYTERALIQTSADRAKLRRQTYRELSDLHAEFQRAMSEPPALSRQATTWWPALVGLEQVMDTVTATAVAVEHGAPAPSPGAVRKLAVTLDYFATSVRTGTPAPPAADLPTERSLTPVTDAVRSVRAVLA